MLNALEDLIDQGIDYECTTEAFRAMQKENNHLFQFCEDIRLDYVANSSMTASQIWEKLEVWYQDNGTLAIEDNGRRVWTDQVVEPPVELVEPVVEPQVEQVAKPVTDTPYQDSEAEKLAIATPLRRTMN